MLCQGRLLENAIYMRHWAILLFSLFLCGCSSVRYLDIQTLQPAEVTFPDNVKTLLVVNNAVPQPEKTGYEYTFMGVLQDTARIHTDSAIVATCYALGKAIAESPYYKDIRLYEEAYNKNGEFLKENKIDPSVYHTQLFPIPPYLYPLQVRLT